MVNTTLPSNFVRPDEANKAQSLVKDKGKHTLIDKVKVRYLSDDDKYWAELVNFGHKIRPHPRALPARLRPPADGRHLGAGRDSAPVRRGGQGEAEPVLDRDLKPIQLATFDLDEYRECRRQFTTDEWVDLLIRSIGMEPSHFDRRLKLLFLIRLRAAVRAELQPRGAGAAGHRQELRLPGDLSPYAILLTGPTTVANLFYNMATARWGWSGIWDAVAFDEVADLQKMPKEVVTTLKTYCESGTFARGKDALSGMASMALFGNTNQPVEVMVRSSHLFMPMPDVIREDMAFLDRIHFYIPGWEVPKMRVEFFTDHYGFVVDYLAEALRELRKHNFTEIIDRHFVAGLAPERPRREGRPQDGLGAGEAGLSPRRGHEGGAGGAGGAGPRRAAAG